jgi:hypothetical protein
MTDGRKRGSQEFADIVPGRTTEVFLDLDESRIDAERADKRQPALVMLQGDLPGQVFRLPIGRQLIGRRTDCNIRLREKAISAHHAEIVRTDAGVSVADLSSMNGTVVNGRRIRSVVFLAQGTLLKLGNSVFKYVDSLVEVELTETLHRRSTVDELTGLLNRQHLLARAAYLIDQASPASPVRMIVVRADTSPGGLREVGKMLRASFDDLDRFFGRVGDRSIAIVAAAEPFDAAVRQSLERAGIRAVLGVSAAESPVETAEAILTRAEDSAS